MKSLTNNPNIVIIGRRGSGRTTLIQDILHNIMNRFSYMLERRGHIYDPLYTGYSLYDKYINGNNIHNTYDKVSIKSIKNKQIENIKIYGSSLPPKFIVQDNSWCGPIPEVQKDLFINHQHYNLTLITSLSYGPALPIIMRANIDYVFIFREHSETNLRKLYENYCGIFPTFQSFEDTFYKYTGNYGCLVINNCTNSMKFEDRVFWYKADLH